MSPVVGYEGQTYYPTKKRKRKKPSPFEPVSLWQTPSFAGKPQDRVWLRTISNSYTAATGERIDDGLLLQTFEFIKSDPGVQNLFSTDREALKAWFAAGERPVGRTIEEQVAAIGAPTFGKRVKARPTRYRAFDEEFVADYELSQTDMQEYVDAQLTEDRYPTGGMAIVSDEQERRTSKISFTGTYRGRFGGHEPIEDWKPWKELADTVANPTWAKYNRRFMEQTDEMLDARFVDSEIRALAGAPVIGAEGRGEWMLSASVGERVARMLWCEDAVKVLVYEHDSEGYREAEQEMAEIQEKYPHLGQWSGPTLRELFSQLGSTGVGGQTYMDEMVTQWWLLSRPFGMSETERVEQYAQVFGTFAGITQDQVNRAKAERQSHAVQTVRRFGNDIARTLLWVPTQAVGEVVFGHGSWSDDMPTWAQTINMAVFPWTIQSQVFHNDPGYYGPLSPVGLAVGGITDRLLTIESDDISPARWKEVPGAVAGILTYEREHDEPDIIKARRLGLIRDSIWASLKFGAKLASRAGQEALMMGVVYKTYDELTTWGVNWLREYGVTGGFAETAATQHRNEVRVDQLVKARDLVQQVALFPENKELVDQAMQALEAIDVTFVDNHNERGLRVSKRQTTTFNPLKQHRGILGGGAEDWNLRDPTDSRLLSEYIDDIITVRQATENPDDFSDELTAWEVGKQIWDTRRVRQTFGDYMCREAGLDPEEHKMASFLTTMGFMLGRDILATKSIGAVWGYGVKSAHAAGRVAGKKVSLGLESDMRALLVRSNVPVIEREAVLTKALGYVPAKAHDLTPYGRKALQRAKNEGTLDDLISKKTFAKKRVQSVLSNSQSMREATGEAALAAREAATGEAILARRRIPTVRLRAAGADLARKLMSLPNKQLRYLFLRVGEGFHGKVTTEEALGELERLMEGVPTWREKAGRILFGERGIEVKGETAWYDIDEQFTMNWALSKNLGTSSYLEWPTPMKNQFTKDWVKHALKGGAGSEWVKTKLPSELAIDRATAIFTRVWGMDVVHAEFFAKNNRITPHRLTASGESVPLEVTKEMIPAEFETNLSYAKKVLEEQTAVTAEEMEPFRTLAEMPEEWRAFARLAAYKQEVALQQIDHVMLTSGGVGMGYYSPWATPLFRALRAEMLWSDKTPSPMRLMLAATGASTYRVPLSHLSHVAGYDFALMTGWTKSDALALSGQVAREMAEISRTERYLADPGSWLEYCVKNAKKDMTDDELSALVRQYVVEGQKRMIIGQARIERLLNDIWRKGLEDENQVSWYQQHLRKKYGSRYENDRVVDEMVAYLPNWARMPDIPGGPVREEASRVIKPESYYGLGAKAGETRAEVSNLVANIEMNRDALHAAIVEAADPQMTEIITGMADRLYAGRIGEFILARFPEAAQTGITPRMMGEMIAEANLVRRGDYTLDALVNYFPGLTMDGIRGSIRTSLDGWTPNETLIGDFGRVSDGSMTWQQLVAKHGEDEAERLRSYLDQSINDATRYFEESGRHWEEVVGGEIYRYQGEAPMRTRNVQLFRPPTFRTFKKKQRYQDLLGEIERGVGQRNEELLEAQKAASLNAEALAEHQGAYDEAKEQVRLVARQERALKRGVLPDDVFNDIPTFERARESYEYRLLRAWREYTKSFTKSRLEGGIRSSAPVKVTDGRGKVHWKPAEQAKKRHAPRMSFKQFEKQYRADHPAEVTRAYASIDEIPDAVLALSFLNPDIRAIHHLKLGKVAEDMTEDEIRATMKIQDFYDHSLVPYNAEILVTEHGDEALSKLLPTRTLQFLAGRVKKHNLRDPEVLREQYAEYLKLRRRLAEAQRDIARASYRQARTRTGAIPRRKVRKDEIEDPNLRQAVNDWEKEHGVPITRSNDMHAVAQLAYEREPGRYAERLPGKKQVRARVPGVEINLNRQKLNELAASVADPKDVKRMKGEMRSLERELSEIESKAAMLYRDVERNIDQLQALERRKYEILQEYNSWVARYTGGEPFYSTPATPDQLVQFYNPPVSVKDWIYSQLERKGHEQLRYAPLRWLAMIDRLQARTGFDTLVAAYKNLILAKPATMFRIFVGDEFLRLFIENGFSWRYFRAKYFSKEMPESDLRDIRRLTRQREVGDDFLAGRIEFDELSSIVGENIAKSIRKNGEPLDKANQRAMQDLLDKQADYATRKNMIREYPVIFSTLSDAVEVNRPTVWAFFDPGEPEWAIAYREQFIDWFRNWSIIKSWRDSYLMVMKNELALVNKARSAKGLSAQKMEEWAGINDAVINPAFTRAQQKAYAIADEIFEATITQTKVPALRRYNARTKTWDRALVDNPEYPMWQAFLQASGRIAPDDVLAEVSALQQLAPGGPPSALVADEALRAKRGATRAATPKLIADGSSTDLLVAQVKAQMRYWTEHPVREWHFREGKRAVPKGRRMHELDNIWPSRERPIIMGARYPGVSKSGLGYRFSRGETWYPKFLWDWLNNASSAMKHSLFMTRFDDYVEAVRERFPMAKEGFVRDMAVRMSMDDVEKISFTASRSILEDSLRNVIFFLPAYRQFATYWLRKGLQKPLIALSLLYGLQEMPDDVELIPGFHVNFRWLTFLTGGAAGTNEAAWASYLPPVGMVIQLPAQMAQMIDPIQFDYINKLPMMGFTKPGIPVTPVVELISDVVTTLTPWRDEPLALPYPWGSPQNAKYKATIYYLRNQIMHGEEPNVEKAWNDWLQKRATQSFINLNLPVHVTIDIPEDVQRIAQADYEFRNATSPGDREAIIWKYSQDTRYPYSKIQEYWRLDTSERAEFLIKPGNEWVRAWVIPLTQMTGLAQDVLFPNEYYEQLVSKQRIFKTPEQWLKDERDKEEVLGKLALTKKYERATRRVEQWRTEYFDEKRFFGDPGSQMYRKFEQDWEDAEGWFAPGGEFYQYTLQAANEEFAGMHEEELTMYYKGSMNEFLTHKATTRELTENGHLFMKMLEENSDWLPYAQQLVQDSPSLMDHKVMTEEDRLAAMKLKYEILTNYNTFLSREDFLKLGFNMSEDQGQQLYNDSLRLLGILQTYDRRMHGRDPVTGKKTGKPIAVFSSEWRELYKWKQAEVRRILTASPSAKWLTMTAGDFLKHLGLAKPAFLRGDGPVGQEIYSVAQSTWLRAYKVLVEYWDVNPPYSRGTAVEAIRSVEPSLVQNADQVIAAWMWHDILSKGNEARSILFNTYNKYTETTGWSLSSGRGQQVEEWMRGYVKRMRKYRLSQWFEHEWKQYNSFGLDLVHALVDPIR